MTKTLKYLIKSGKIFVCKRFLLVEDIRQEFHKLIEQREILTTTCAKQHLDKAIENVMEK